MTSPQTNPSPLLADLPESFAEGPAWLDGLRGEAAAQLRATGLPSRRTEAWRFTPVRDLLSEAYGERVGTAVTPPVAGALDGRAVCFVNQDIRQQRLPAHVHRLRDHLPALEGHFGRIAPREHFAALNTARFTGGIAIDIPAGVRLEEPLHLFFDVAPAPEGPSAIYPRLLVRLGKGAQLTLIEHHRSLGEAGAPLVLSNVVSEVVVGEGAHLCHVRVSDVGVGVAQVHHIATRVQRAGCYRSHVATFGGRLARVEHRVELAGEGAECSLDGVYLAEGGEHVDHQTHVTHAVPQGTSRQVYRGVVGGSGRAVFNGIVVVERDAQRASAHQENRNLLLSEDAVVHTKPHLEIDADDVSCSHGATVGSLDEGALFYLRSRGIGEPEARALLTYAFVGDLVEELPKEARGEVRERLADRLAQGEGASVLGDVLDSNLGDADEGEGR